MKRAGGRCERVNDGKRCWHTMGLQLHHPKPISHNGSIVQPDAVILCPSCHRIADREAGAINR